jgi:ribonuclease J
MTPKDELIFLPLGGSGEIGMNANLYGCDGKWLLVDLGMTFADSELPGIDLVFPDLAFIEERAKDLVGIVLTHGHEDHIGAIPYLAADLGVPLYATRFTAGLIRHKLADEGVDGELTVHEVERGEVVELGPFRIRHVPLAHSIPEGNAVLIETPYGTVFHTGDWKLDDAPVIGVPSTEAELTRIGDAGVLALVGDSTNVFNPEASGSEAGVRAGLEQAVAAARGRVLVTTFASNAARLHTLGEVAHATGRRVVLAGRSVERNLKVAQGAGYLSEFPEAVSFDEAMTLPPHEVLVIATGGQGEARAALARIADGTHPLKLARGDTVIFSTRQIPGNEGAIGRVQNALAALGVEIVTASQAHVHVSGHPGRPELEAIFRWIRPRIAVPVHGERRHLEEHARLARSCGVPHAVVPVNGAAIRLAPGAPTVVAHQKVGRLVLDGDVILPADGSTMVARRRLGVQGYLAATLVLSGKGRLAADPAIHLQGVPVEEDRGEFIADCRKAAREAVNGGGRSDREIEDAVRQALRRVAREWTGKKPLTDVALVRV